MSESAPPASGASADAVDGGRGESGPGTVVLLNVYDVAPPQQAAADGDNGGNGGGGPTAITRLNNLVRLEKRRFGLAPITPSSPRSHLPTTPHYTHTTTTTDAQPVWRPRRHLPRRRRARRRRVLVRLLRCVFSHCLLFVGCVCLGAAFVWGAPLPACCINQPRRKHKQNMTGAGVGRV